MEGENKISPERKKKMKKAKLSKTVAGQAAKKEDILNRMSSGKKRPRSEPRSKKGLKTPTKDDLIVKRLQFGDDDDGSDGDEKMRFTPSKSKMSKKGKVLGSASAKKSAKKLLGATSKWQVSVTKSSEKTGKDVAKRETTPSNSSREAMEDDDGEVDFPILKRKSLGGVEIKTSLAGKTKIADERKTRKESSQNGQSKNKLKKLKQQKEKGGGLTEEDKPRRKESSKVLDEGKKKKKSKKRGRKRKRSTSESEEPETKRGKQAPELAVRCGNLPIGASKSDLEMFIGEADVFPTSINIKRIKKSGQGQKKLFVTYATIMCRSSDEVDRLCRLNRISMPSPTGKADSKLLIHKMTPDNEEDVTFKRKLFVRNLHPKTTEQDLMDFFEEGKFNPMNAIVPRKGDSKNSRGYAFVWLNSSGDVDRVLGMKNHTLRDQVLVVARSHQRTQTNMEP